jgi:transcriptional regulator with XRE-family HTH domain
MAKAVLHKKIDPWRLRLRQALDDRRLDYSDVSVRAGFNHEYVSKMLNGRINPTIERVQKICEVAEIKFSFLFLEDEEERALNDSLDLATSLKETEAALLARLIASTAK